MITGDHRVCLGDTAPASERGKCSAENDLLACIQCRGCKQSDSGADLEAGIQKK